MHKKDISIFIVEDEHIVALDIKEQLLDLGYNIAGLASEGNDAIKKILEIKPNLILMDIMLKGSVNGVEVASKIRETENTPIIFLTGNADDTTLNSAKVIQPFFHLIKPFDVKELHNMIANVLESIQN